MFLFPQLFFFSSPPITAKRSPPFPICLFSSSTLFSKIYGTDGDFFLPTETPGPLLSPPPDFEKPKRKDGFFSLPVAADQNLLRRSFSLKRALILAALSSTAETEKARDAFTLPSSRFFSSPLFRVVCPPLLFSPPLRLVVRRGEAVSTLQNSPSADCSLSFFFFSPRFESNEMMGSLLVPLFFPRVTGSC